MLGLGRRVNEILSGQGRNLSRYGVIQVLCDQGGGFLQCLEAKYEKKTNRMHEQKLYH
jgi:hypothetical protein